MYKEVFTTLYTQKMKTIFTLLPHACECVIERYTCMQLFIHQRHNTRNTFWFGFLFHAIFWIANSKHREQNSFWTIHLYFRYKIWSIWIGNLKIILYKLNNHNNIHSFDSWTFRKLFKCFIFYQIFWFQQLLCYILWFWINVTPPGLLVELCPQIYH